MQVDKILDAVVGSTAAGMVEASLAPAADSGMEDVAPESSQNQPVPLCVSPGPVITVGLPTQTSLYSCRQRTFCLGWA